MGNPPGSAPDEYAHYLRALGAGRGQVLLSRRPPPPADLARLPLDARWRYETSRLVDLPPALDPRPLNCSAFRPERTAACLDRPPPDRQRVLASAVGTYPPAVYVPAGLLMRLAGGPQAADRLGRLGFVLLSAAFLALAAHLVWDPRAGPWSLVGLLAAVTPMVVFMTSVLSANNVEIAAGLCFAAGLVRLSRGDPEGRWVWVAVGASGTVLALARDTGPLWVAAGAGAFVVAAGPRPALAACRRGGRRALLALGAVGLAVFATAAWAAVVEPQPHRSIGAVLRGTRGGVHWLLLLWHDGIGLFGWLDTGMLPAAYKVWTLLLVSLLVAALVLGTWRQRAVLLVLAVATVGLVLLVYSLNAPTGFGPQARYFLPFVGVVPLWAGEVLRRRRLSTPGVLPAWLVPAAAAAAAAVQVHAWWFNARRYAVGAAGPVQFLGREEWAPPLGWAPWLVLAVAGAVLLVAATTPSPRADATP